MNSTIKQALVSKVLAKALLCEYYFCLNNIPQMMEVPFLKDVKRHLYLLELVSKSDKE